MTTDVFIAGLVGMTVIACAVAAFSYLRTSHEDETTRRVDQ